MRVAALWILLLGASQGHALEVHNLRVWPAPDNTRIVFDLSEAARYELFTIDNPPRVVVDLKGATVAAKLPQPGPDSSLLRAVRHGPRGGGDLRVVFDLSRSIRARSSLLTPNEKYGHRLLIELSEDVAQDAQPFVRAVPVAPGPNALPVLPMSTREVPALAAGGRDRKVVVAIDAGHGGEDPGASGRRGTREKDITLAIARQLVEAMNREEGMRAVLTRDGDYFIPLRKRIERARAQHADLFVSIHADAYRSPRVTGSSVYVLSQRGASSEAARWLANQENAADHIGGVTLEDKDDMLKSVLLDLSQTASIEASVNVAREVLDRLDQVGNIRKRQVQHAGFVVLKSPDIPSILVETAYITNPEEEKKLQSRAHQRLLARAIATGVRRYFENSPPPGTLLAEQLERRLASSR